jgi:hypothetical protein
MASGSAISTTPEERPLPRLVRGRMLRRTGIALLVLFVGAGLLNLFGSHSATVTAENAGLNLSVFYPQRTRPSLPIKWKLVLTSANGFEGPVDVAVNESYFNYFDFNNFYPTPDSTESRGDVVVFTFPAPAGDTLNVLFDGRTQPGQVGRAAADTSILDDGGAELVSVHYTTEVFP